jgi:hypothetical protein
MNLATVTGSDMDDYEQWTRAEIAQLRMDAQKASAEADVMQRKLDKWLASQGRQSDLGVKINIVENQGLNGTTHRRTKRPGYGDKNATALNNIKTASPYGLTTDELFSIFAELYGPKYKRSSLRALLWHQKDLENIELKGGRYVIATKEATP